MTVTILVGDALERLRMLADDSVQCCITSPPYWGLRNYGVAGQLGAEKTPEEYAANLVEVFREVRRVLTDDGTLWLNLGDSYARVGGVGKPGPNAKVGNTRRDIGRRNLKPPPGLKDKDLVGIPWRVALALQADGWWLRSDIIWNKPNAMPRAVRDRVTNSHEYLFMLSKSKRYFFNGGAIAEPVAAENRPQRIRARQLAAEKGLTPEHLAAIRAAGVSDTGKARHTQTGTDKNTEEVIRLAREAKDALGGYYREFLTNPDGTRNRRSVWTIATQPYPGAHFALFPPQLVEPCILAGSRPGDTVLDPFGGAGTTALVAREHGRNSILIELNPEYADLTRKRLGLATEET